MPSGPMIPTLGICLTSPKDLLKRPSEAVEMLYQSPPEHSPGAKKGT